MLYVDAYQVKPYIVHMTANKETILIKERMLNFFVGVNFIFFNKTFLTVFFFTDNICIIY